MHEDDHQNLFAEAMGRVKPLENSDKVHIEKTKSITPRNRIIQRSPQTVDLPMASAQRPQAGQDEPWLLIADGVSKETLKRLAAGRPAIDLSFDLHGITRDAALTMVEDGLEQALQEGMRVLCIVHGRGLHSQGRPILKQAVYHWLSEGPLAHMVLVVMPQPNSGGGACLVLLRRQHKQ